MKLVISSENSCYMSWQALTCARSWTQVSGERAAIVVHETGAALHPIFDRAKDIADVVEAPGFRGATDYAPRNACGSAIVSAEAFPGEDLVHVDPDFVFTRKSLFSGALSGARYTSMSREAIRESAQRAGMRWERVERHIHRLSIGAPYFVPAALAMPVARSWLEIVDRLRDADRDGPWSDSMFAFSFAALECGAVPEVVDDQVDFNLPAGGQHLVKTPMIHYAFASKAWDKRQFRHDHDLAELWRGQSRLHGVGEPGSVLGEVLKQIRETGREFGFTT